jgi:hypothetical protein
MNINLAGKVSLLFLAAASAAFAAPAAAFTFQDDPSSTWNGDNQTTRTFAGNTVTYHDLFATNETSNNLPSLSFAIPFAWPVVSGAAGDTQVPMQWRNDLHGWFTDNFNNTGTSLTVALANPNPLSIAMGQIADLTGNAQLPLTEPCNSGSPSCTQTSYPPETRAVGDQIPAVSLGAFAPHETKRFDLSFNYAYGDERGGALPTAFIGNTISPVPEPETYAMFLTGIAVLAWAARRRKDIFGRC